MKQVFHKIASVLMTFTVLFSTLSFTVDKHYCGGDLVDTAIFGKAQTCGMEMEQASNSDCSVVKKDCCSEENEVIKGQDELNSSFGSLTFEQQFFIVSYVHSYISLFEVLENNNTFYREYSPPLIVKDIQKIDETYLI